MHKQTVVIVGASRGIGKELVHYFAKDSQTKVFALSRNLEAMKEFSIYENVQFFAFDLEDPNSKENAELIFSQLNFIDLLINNAGKLINKPFLELSDTEITSAFQVNIIGVMQTVQAAVPKMLERGGHIVNISSMGGFQGTVKFSGLSAYSTSKAALVSFTELFAEEYKDSKIKMNCLCLGSVQTEMLEEAFPGYEAPLKASEMAAYIGDFAKHAHKFMHGRIIPVSLTTP